MACAPGLMIPAFSVAILVTVSPSRWAWSTSIGVTTATPASATLVASHVPPSPTSMTATSTGASAKAAYAMAVMISKKVIGTPSIERSSTISTYGAISSQVASKRSSLIGAPSMVIRSVTLDTCGEVKRPVRRPSARSSDSIIAAVLPLPLVPVRWITGYARCGSPSSSVRAWIRPRLGATRCSGQRAVSAVTISAWVGSASMTASV